MKDTCSGIRLPVAILNDNCYAKPIFLRICSDEYKTIEALSEQKSLSLNKNSIQLKRKARSHCRNYNNLKFGDEIAHTLSSPKSSLTVYKLKRAVNSSYLNSHDFPNNTIKNYRDKTYNTITSDYNAKSYLIHKNRVKKPCEGRSFSISNNAYNKTSFSRVTKNLDRLLPSIEKNETINANKTKYQQIKEMLYQKINNIELEEIRNVPILENEERIFYNGEIYKGEVTEGNKFGKGTCKFKDGRIYDGSWKYGKIDGEGTMLNIDGTVYEGNFLQGVAEGNIKIYVHSSSVFIRRIV